MIRLDAKNRPLNTPIYQTSKFSMASIEDLRQLFKGGKQGFLYSRFSNPTVRELELEIARMQGQEDAICMSSGCAAISNTLLSVLKSGDTMLMFIESYKPSRYLALHILQKFGVRIEMLSMRDPDLQNKIVAMKPKLVLFESPTNPSLFIPDIQAITTAAKSVQALCVKDNTFAGLGEHHDCGIDVYIHSLSKQANGHGDVIAGAVIASKSWINTHRNNFVNLGACMDPNSAFLVLRGLQTFAMRSELQSANAFELAKFMQSKPEWFCNVRHPMLESHPQFDLAKRQLKSGGYVIAAEFNGDESSFEKFVATLKKFHLTGSLGSLESLIAPSHLFYSGELTDEQTKACGIEPTSFRLSIGIDEVSVLVEDLSHAAEVSL